MSGVSENDRGGGLADHPTARRILLRMATNKVSSFPSSPSQQQPQQPPPPTATTTVSTPSPASAAVSSPSPPAPLRICGAARSTMAHVPSLMDIDDDSTVTGVTAGETGRSAPLRSAVSVTPPPPPLPRGELEGTPMLPGWAQPHPPLGLDAAASATPCLRANVRSAFGPGPGRRRYRPPLRPARISAAGASPTARGRDDDDPMHLPSSSPSFVVVHRLSSESECGASAAMSSLSGATTNERGVGVGNTGRRGKGVGGASLALAGVGGTIPSSSGSPLARSKASTKSTVSQTVSMARIAASLASGGNRRDRNDEEEATQNDNDDVRSTTESSIPFDERGDVGDGGDETAERSERRGGTAQQPDPEVPSVAALMRRWERGGVTETSIARTTATATRDETPSRFSRRLLECHLEQKRSEDREDYRDDGTVTAQKECRVRTAQDEDEFSIDRTPGASVESSFIRASKAIGGGVTGIIEGLDGRQDGNVVGAAAPPWQLRHLSSSAGSIASEGTSTVSSLTETSFDDSTAVSSLTESVPFVSQSHRWRGGRRAFVHARDDNRPLSPIGEEEESELMKRVRWVPSLVRLYQYKLARDGIARGQHLANGGPQLEREKEEVGTVGDIFVSGFINSLAEDEETTHRQSRGDQYFNVDQVDSSFDSFQTAPLSAGTDSKLPREESNSPQSVMDAINRLEKQAFSVEERNFFDHAGCYESDELHGKKPTVLNGALATKDTASMSSSVEGSSDSDCFTIDLSDCVLAGAKELSCAPLSIGNCISSPDALVSTALEISVGEETSKRCNKQRSTKYAIRGAARNALEEVWRTQETVLRYLETNNYEMAIGEYEELLCRCEGGVGFLGKNEQNKVIGLVMHNIAVLHMRAGNYDVADLWGESALSRRDATDSGVFHKDVAIALNEMGIAHFACGRYDEALRSFVDVLCIRQEIYGVLNESIASVCNNIGLAHYALDAPHEALEAFEEALEVCLPVLVGKRSKGDACFDDDLQSMESRAVLGAIAANVDTSSLIRDGSSIVVEQTLLAVSSTLCNIGHIYSHLRRFEDSRVAFEEAVAIQQMTLRPNDVRIISSKAWLKQLATSLKARASLGGIDEI